MNLYEKHLKSFGYGKIREPGNSNKNSLNDFLNVFKHINESIISRGFDASESLVPVDHMMSATNGSHRIASSIFHGKEIHIEKSDISRHIYDYKFFRTRGFSASELDVLALTYTRYAKTPFVAVVWPRAEYKRDDLSKFFPNIYYQKKVVLSSFGLRELIESVIKMKNG